MAAGVIKAVPKRIVRKKHTNIAHHISFFVACAMNGILSKISVDFFVAVLQ